MMAPTPSLTRSAPGGLGWGWLTPAAEMAAAVSASWPVAPLPGGELPRVATRTLAPGAGSVPGARRFAEATLRRWQIAGRRDDVVTVVSELTTNALRHGLPLPGAPGGGGGGAGGTAWPRWLVRVGLVQSGPYVLCAVGDPSDRVPALAEPGCWEETGRGLHVVTALSDDWGCTPPSPAGKVVWATFTAGCGW
jgi:hypothetical protein